MQYEQKEFLGCENCCCTFDYCTSILLAAKNPEKAMDLITYFASEEGIMNIAFGPEGQMWKKENAICKMELVGNEALARELIGEKNDYE